MDKTVFLLTWLDNKQYQNCFMQDNRLSVWVWACLTAELGFAPISATELIILATAPAVPRSWDVWWRLPTLNIYSIIHECH